MRPKHHRAGRVPTPPAGRPAPELPETRVRELRTRVREGVYDAPGVAGVVARRVLEEGDL